MAEKYSSEFKAKVALEVVSENRAVITKVAQKYDVPEEKVKEWTDKLYNDASHIFDDEQAEEFAHGEDFASENVYISTDDARFHHDVDYGATKDDLNYKKIIFWSSFIVGLVIIMAIGLVYFAQFSLFDAQQKVSSISPASTSVELREKQNKKLNSYGVIDLENGIYKIPIDSAISKIAID